MDDRTTAALYARDVSGLTFTRPQRCHDDEPPDNCAEIGVFPEDGVVVLRDSKTSRMLFFTRREWAALCADIRDGQQVG